LCGVKDAIFIGYIKSIGPELEMTRVQEKRIGVRHGIPGGRPGRASIPIGSNDLLIAAQGTLSGIASELLGMEELPQRIGDDVGVG
jgi:hypothetical protein